MAEIVAANLTGGERRFTGGDLSAKLKLMGIDVASFGESDAGADRAVGVRYEDPFGGVYRKLLFSLDGARLLGGVLVGDASDYALLSTLAKEQANLPAAPGDLARGASGATTPVAAAALGDTAQICSCNAVSKGTIRAAVRAGGCRSLEEVKGCTKAGTGCGGCLPLVTDIFRAEMETLGETVTHHLCEHFPYARQELFAIVKVKGYRTFAETIAGHGTGLGCEICKPAVASILASLWNENVLDHATIQDTNDRFLANIQRGGLYSVVPRVPGGEISPEKLIVLGEVAREYKLYTKITGGQRVDLFGAQVHQLPEIWERLVDAGFESGHAYGKAMRTVKSCVGTTWCRYGVGDSVGLAIRVENRYRGLRAPHKLKSAVSGCTRECAEAQSKDFGLIATEKGWNLYVCGNGGMKPRHADLLAADLDADTAMRYIDRFLMYYIQTADKLTRTSVWIEKLEGGLARLRAIVVDDALGIGDELERQMQCLVDSYTCEWTEVVRNPERRTQFQQFVNSAETEHGIELIDERGQTRPADWPKDGTLPPLAGERFNATAAAGDRSWVRVGAVADFPAEGGAAIRYGKTQIAVFRLASRDEWYATQNLCPHKRALVLSRGLVGDAAGIPKVACPLHKKTFGLRDGKCLSGDDYSLSTFPVKVEDGSVFLFLPPAERVDAALGTDAVCIRAGGARTSPQSVGVEPPAPPAGG
jgi:nitrite reductase (NADH) large subunit